MLDGAGPFRRFFSHHAAAVAAERDGRRAARHHRRVRRVRPVLHHDQWRPVRRHRSAGHLDHEDGLRQEPAELRRRADRGAGGRRDGDLAGLSQGSRSGSMFTATERRRSAGEWVQFGVAVLLVAAMFYPTVWMVLSAFKTNREIFRTPFALPLGVALGELCRSVGSWASSARSTSTRCSLRRWR